MCIQLLQLRWRETKTNLYTMLQSAKYKYLCWNWSIWSRHRNEKLVLVIMTHAHKFTLINMYTPRSNMDHLLYFSQSKASRSCSLHTSYNTQAAWAQENIRTSEPECSHFILLMKTSICSKLFLIKRSRQDLLLSNVKREKLWVCLVIKTKMFLPAAPHHSLPFQSIQNVNGFQTALLVHRHTGTGTEEKMES